MSVGGRMSLMRMNRTMDIRSVTVGDLRELCEPAPAAGCDPPSDPADIGERASAVAAVAAANADTIDREARFPGEAIAAARAQRLLGIAVPRELGGEGARMSGVLDVCYRLGRACASTAMIYAMHQTKVACLVRHSRGSAWHERVLRRIAEQQLLLASSTTEGRAGGDVRRSDAPIETRGDRITLDRSATVISFGAQADGIVTTARRSSAALPSDQVLAVLLKDDYRLEPLVGWDTLGMRGTCSAGFALRADCSSDRVLPVPYETIHARTMMPVAHLTWSAVWSGVAADAVERARLFVRAAARRSNGQLPPGAAHLTRAVASLKALRASVAAAARRFEASDERTLESFELQSAFNLLKVESSEAAVATVMSTFHACGLAGYRNDSEFSVGRHLRDVLSAPIMINNDRILANAATAAMLSAVPATLRD
jgi:acyl-CoA dehydrogenase